MSEEIRKIDSTELEEVSGGNDGQFGPQDSIHNLAAYDQHVVAHLPAGTCLVMKYHHEPGSAVMPGHAFYNGDTIWVHNRYWEGGCFLAYDNGDYGYVDARYVM